MSIHAVIWDFGGVLMRTVDYSPRQRLATQLGVSPLELEQIVWGDENDFRAQRGELTEAEHWAYVGRRLGQADDQALALREVFYSGDQLDMLLVDYIRQLKQLHYTALLSNAFSTLRQFLSEELEIDDAFHHIVVSAEVGLMKPDAAIYELTLERLGVAPEEAVFIDDTMRNVEGAHYVGMHAIHFKDRQQTRAELQDLLAE